MTASAAVDVKRAAHRQVRFETLDELVTEVNRLRSLERRGSLSRSGNWTLGQTFGHLAYWIDVPFDGYPPEVRPPRLVKLLGPFLKRRVLKGPMLRGLRFSTAPEGTFGTERLLLDEGHLRLIKAIERLSASSPPRDNLVFGPMTHGEWIMLNLRHAELHLGYFDV